MEFFLLMPESVSLGKADEHGRFEKVLEYKQSVACCYNTVPLLFFSGRYVVALLRGKGRVIKSFRFEV